MGAAAALKEDGAFLRGHKIVVRKHMPETREAEEALEDAEEGRTAEEGISAEAGVETQDQPAEIPDCKFYVARGYCKFKDTCKLRHPPRLPVSEALGDEGGALQPPENALREASASSSHYDADQGIDDKPEKSGKHKQ